MSDEPPKLATLSTARDKTQAEIEAMRRSLAAMLAAAPEIAAMKRRMYEEYMNVGFTKEEALVLCQKLTL